jgi:hypothetical protein
MKQGNLQLNKKEDAPIFTDRGFVPSTNIFSYFSFTIRDLLYWWYIQMPILHLKKLNRISTVVSDQLSMRILFQNFFLPWKRHKSVVGYFIGITLKIVYFPIAIAIYTSAMILYLTFMLFWLLIPILAFFFTLISLILN